MTLGGVDATGYPMKRPGSAVEYRTSTPSAFPARQIQRSSSAGPARPRTAGTRRADDIDQGQRHFRTRTVYARAVPGDIHDTSRTCDFIPVKARVQYDTIELSNGSSDSSAVDSMLQAWKNALRQLCSGYFRLRAAQQRPSESRTAELAPAVAERHSRPATARAHSTATPRNCSAEAPIQRPKTGRGCSMQYKTPGTFAEHHPSDTCTISESTDAPTLAIMFVALASSLFELALGGAQRPSTCPGQPGSSLQDPAVPRISAPYKVLNPSTDISSLGPAVETLLMASHRLQKSCGAASQVASLKQDLQLLHHDNTLLRNALARAQQESTEYALCTRSTPQNSTAVKSTEHQHTDTALSMSKEASQLAEQLQAELDACKHKIAQESDEKQTQQATCQKLQHKLDCTQQRAKAAQERAGKAETLVETLTSRIGILEAELDEANAADAVGCSASTAIQTDKMPVEQHSADNGVMDECAKLQKEVESLRLSLAVKEAANVDAAAKSAQHENDLKKLENDLQLFKDRESTLHKAVRLSQSEAAEARAAAAVATTQYNAMQQNLQSQHATTMKHKDRLTEEQQATTRQHEHAVLLQDQLTQCEETLRSTEKQLTEAREQCASNEHQIASLQESLKASEKQVSGCRTRAEESERSASAAIADLTALRQLHAELGLLHGDHSCNRVTSEDLADLKRELQSLQKVRRRLEVSAKGLRAAQVLQDSNVLQLRVDGGARALADSRAESARSRQQLREMHSRLLEIQRVATQQASEIALLRGNVTEGHDDNVAYPLTSDMLLHESSCSPAGEEVGLHTARLYNLQSSLVDSAKDSDLDLSNDTLAMYRKEHSLDGDSYPVEEEDSPDVGISPKEGHLLKSNEVLCQEQSEKKVSDKGTVDRGAERATHARLDEQQEPPGIVEQAADVHAERHGSQLDGNGKQAAADSDNGHLSPSNVIGNSRPPSFRSLASSTMKQSAPVNSSLCFTDKNMSCASAWLTQGTALLPSSIHWDSKGSSRAFRSPDMAQEKRLSKVNAAVPTVPRRSSVGGAAIFQSALGSAEQSLRSASHLGLPVGLSGNRFPSRGTLFTNLRNSRKASAHPSVPTRSGNTQTQHVGSNVKGISMSVDLRPGTA